MEKDGVKSTCPYCGVGCGVEAVSFGDAVVINGDVSHPANYGRLCSKGTQLSSTLELDNRLLKPMIAGEETNWDHALDTVAQKFSEVIDEHGPEAVAFYVSGQLLTEDYYVANKLMKGAIGSANIDTNSRLCMASSVVGHKRAFGSDTVACGYEDLESADLVVLIGSNLAWCHPVLYQRLIAARSTGSGPALVVIDPRKTATVADADLHLPIKPGMDNTLFNGLLCYLERRDKIDQTFVSRHTEGYLEAYISASEYASITSVAEQCDLNVSDVRAFYELFAATDKTVSVYSQGVNQSSIGTDKVNAIINLHLATGRIGKPGAGPFSVTGQPNAMGGREVGGLANQLAAHMGFSEAEVDRVARFWNLPETATYPGKLAVSMFDEIAIGNIKALWVMGTNPAVSMPLANDVDAALQKLDFLVVSEVEAQTDTSLHADVVLPALAWGEKDGTVTNSERCISRQRKILEPPVDAKADWWIISQVAARMGFDDEFSYQSSADIFREHARLSAFENNGSRDFDIGGLASLSDKEYEQLSPSYWPLSEGSASSKPVDIFSKPKFYTANSKAQFVPITTSGVHVEVERDYPLLLNSGRLRDQWHTMTRTARASKLNQHNPEPTISLHPLDARQLSIINEQLVDLTSRSASVRLRAKLSRDVKPGEAFVPMHWSRMNASSAHINSLFAGQVDPFSGQPELKSEPVSVVAASIAKHALIFDRSDYSLIETSAYWVKSKFDDCTVQFLAFEDGTQATSDWARKLLGDGEEILVTENQRRQCFVALNNQRLERMIIISEHPVNMDAGWLANYFSIDELGASERQNLIAGKPLSAAGAANCGGLVCSCFSAARHDIEFAIHEQGVTTVAAIGASLKSGTNCGSCIPELKQMVENRSH